MKQLCNFASALALAAALAACEGGNSLTSSVPSSGWPQIGMPSVAAHTEIAFRGHHFLIGSAAAKTRGIQQMTGPNVGSWPAHGALFVADPSLNGVMVYDERQAGAGIRPYGILSGPNTALNGPVALATGSDSPCTTTCTPYIWVANAGNSTITYYTTPLTSWNQAPAGTISWNGNPYCTGSTSTLSGSSAPLQFPYGIAHTVFGGGNPGQIIQTSEANVSGQYWISTWTANDNGPSQCFQAYSSPSYDTPSGLSIYPLSAIVHLIFNANNTSVTESTYAGVGGWSSQGSWSPGPNACTEGTAVTPPGYVWVTTNAGCKYPRTDALWTCLLNKFNNGCPPNPACTNPVAKLDFPDLPGYSAVTSRLYVPNQNNGTATSYAVGANNSVRCRPKSIYINLQTPIGVALQV